MEKQQTIRFWRGRLPHWEVVDASYFITLRLAGTLPVLLKTELNGLMKDVCQDDYLDIARQYFQKIEAWLDNDTTFDVLSQANVAEMIISAFREYESRSIWQVHSFVVMPNHLHWFFTPVGQGMIESVRNFKRYTARQVNQCLGTVGKRFWQSEWFDHWSRSPLEDDKIITYIRNNPVKAGLVARAEDWPYLK